MLPFSADYSTDEPEKGWMLLFSTVFRSLNGSAGR